MQNKVLNDFPGNWPSLPVAFCSPEVHAYEYSSKGWGLWRLSGPYALLNACHSFQGQHLSHTLLDQLGKFQVG